MSADAWVQCPKCKAGYDEEYGGVEVYTGGSPYMPHDWSKQSREDRMAGEEPPLTELGRVVVIEMAGTCRSCGWRFDMGKIIITPGENRNTMRWEVHGSVATEIEA